MARVGFWVGLALCATFLGEGACSNRALLQDPVPPFMLQIDTNCFHSNITKGNGCGGNLDGSAEPVCKGRGARHTLLSCCPTELPQPFQAEDQLSCQSFLPPYGNDFSRFFACSGNLPFSSCCCAYYLPSEIAQAG